MGNNKKHIATICLILCIFSSFQFLSFETFEKEFPIYELPFQINDSVLSFSSYVEITDFKKMEKSNVVSFLKMDKRNDYYYVARIYVNDLLFLIFLESYDRYGSEGHYIRDYYHLYIFDSLRNLKDKLIIGEFKTIVGNDVGDELEKRRTAIINSDLTIEAEDYEKVVFIYEYRSYRRHNLKSKYIIDNEGKIKKISP